MGVTDALLLAGSGLLGGAVNAIAGGGSLIVFPTLVAAGYGTLVANVTNSVALWPGYVGGVVGFRQELVGQRGRVVSLAAAAIVGAAIGCGLLLATPASAFDTVVPFLVLAASLLLAVQPRIAGLVGPPTEDHRDSARVLYPTVGLASVYGGYFGGALGVILLGVLALTVHDSLRRLNALKAVLSLVVASVTLVVFGLFGPVDWVAVAVIAPASLLGGFLGAKVARRLDDRVLRWAVVVFGVLVAVLLFLRNR
ncbi:MAG TPA: sulfite exporter TauE/SafE family protein [Mycobacteriales bacterium]|nr:sulfite exporter TauE/SafE family protein [Mycobacteriales bacterium]